MNSGMVTVPCFGRYRDDIRLEWLARERLGLLPIARGAVLLAAWLSAATAMPLVAAPQAPTKSVESHDHKSRALESRTLRLHLDNGLLSLDANRQSFAEVLGAIQKETGIRFHYNLPMAEEVSLSFDDVPVADALKLLLGREAQFMFRFPERSSNASRTAVPEEVWILGNVSVPGAEAGRPMQSPVPSVTESGTGSIQSAKLPVSADPNTSKRAEIESLIETTKSGDPSQRLQALSSLDDSDRADQVAVHAVLEAGLTDEDGAVRARAAHALVTRDGTDYLVQALYDQDPRVRISALESVVPAKHGSELVEQALSDPDPAVRAAAEAILSKNQ